MLAVYFLNFGLAFSSISVLAASRISVTKSENLTEAFFNNYALLCHW
jgi:hypothetical protein